MEKEKKETKSQYVARHQRENFDRHVVMIRKNDEEMIKKLDSVNASEYIYDLIKKDMEKNNAKQER